MFPSLAPRIVECSITCVNCEGPMKTARQGMSTEGEDRRIDLVIRELERYNVVATTLQETK